MSLAEGRRGPLGVGSGCQGQEGAVRGMSGQGCCMVGEAVTTRENQGFPQGGPWKGWGALLTSGLTPLVVDVEGAPLVHTGDDLVVSAVEAVHADHAGLLLGVGVVRVGGVEIILKHGQAVQVLDLRGAGSRVSTRERAPPSVSESPSASHPDAIICAPNAIPPPPNAMLSSSSGWATPLLSSSRVKTPLILHRASLPRASGTRDALSFRTPFL